LLAQEDEALPHMPGANRRKTAAAVEILLNVQSIFGRFKSFLEPVTAEIMLAVYDNANKIMSQSPPSREDLGSGVMFFDLVKQQDVRRAGRAKKVQRKERFCASAKKGPARAQRKCNASEASPENCSARAKLEQIKGLGASNSAHSCASPRSRASGSLLPALPSLTHPTYTHPPS
jgi:hypothetical protein